MSSTDVEVVACRWRGIREWQAVGELEAQFEMLITLIALVRVWGSDFAIPQVAGSSHVV